jgi:hypothetical protein
MLGLPRILHQLKNIKQNIIMQQATFRRVQACAVPSRSLLAQHISQYPKPYWDCFELQVVTSTSSLSNNTTNKNVAGNNNKSPNHPVMVAMSFAKSFFTSPAFRMEAFVLESVRLGASAFSPPQLDQGVADTDHNSTRRQPTTTTTKDSFGSGLFRPKETTENEIILDSGMFLHWLQVDFENHFPGQNNDASESHRSDDMGRVVYFRLGTICKHPTFLVMLLKYPHLFYSKLLLASAVKHHVSASPSS